MYVVRMLLFITRFNYYYFKIGNGNNTYFYLSKHLLISCFVLCFFIPMGFTLSVRDRIVFICLTSER